MDMTWLYDKQEDISIYLVSISPSHNMPTPLYRAKAGSTSDKTATSVTPRITENTMSNSVPSHPAHMVYASRSQHDFLSRPLMDPSNTTRQHRNMPSLTHSRSGSHFQTVDRSENRLSTGPSLIMSSMSSMPSLKQNQDHNSRRPNGLKATIRRMFGSKHRQTLVDESRKEYHKSDPGYLINTDDPQHQRGYSSGSSRPRTATKGGPLTSHAIDLASDVRDFGTHPSEQQLGAYKRRNTLPSLSFSEHEAQKFSPHVEQIMNYDPLPAVSDDVLMLKKDKRRSRSAEDLVVKPDVKASDAASRQDRESEIAFWRNSTLLHPIPKSTRSAAINPRPNASTDNIKEMPSLDHIINPAQSFDFGLDEPAEEPMDLEERVSTLEVKMFDFEYAIAKLQGIELPKPTLPRKMMKRKNVQEVFSQPSMQSLSTATSGLDRPPITPGDSPVMLSSFKENMAHDRESKATIRPIIRIDSPSRTSFRMTAEQFDNIMNMIQDEKDARQIMEMQIMDLQREIELLQAPVYATINYPTFDANKAASAQKKLHRAPPFRINRPTVRETSMFSMTESDPESTNDGFEEAFETPREQQHTFHTANSTPIIGMV